ncbi:MAG: SIR2 family protein [Gemmatimonadaceae bacterium]|nr:SIR2 family protein [Gemmatimonadaceae bacterium]
MSLLEAKSGRAELLRVIRDRFAYVHAFPELYRASTRFHSELSTIYLIDTIVTTNWDDYFETECGALPFVTAEDFAFWSVQGRKVFKLHGSVNSYGSIVATRVDYADSYKRLEGGLIGANLKMMLATKTIIYAGFSFNDDDLLRIHKFLSSEMRGRTPTPGSVQRGLFRSIPMQPTSLLRSSDGLSQSIECWRTSDFPACAISWRK